jgi:hypothetical protein
MIPDDTHLLIGSLMFEGMDQIDLTGLDAALAAAPQLAGEKRGVIGNAAKTTALMVSSRCSAPIAEEPGELAWTQRT